MGNLLSFPLLCITNYLAFRYLVPDRTLPVLINGDDIAFRSTPAVAQRWMSGVRRAGFTLSVGKTLLHERYFSLNSTFFEGRASRKPSLVPIVRAKCIYAPIVKGDGRSLAQRLFRSCNGLPGSMKAKVKGQILRWHRSAAKAVGCSFNRALGVRVTHDSLAEANLLEQEVFYLRLPKDYDVPRKEMKPDVEVPTSPVTRGWKQVRLDRSIPKDRRELLSVLWGEHCTEHAWSVWEKPVAGFAFEPPIVSFQGLRHLASKARLLRTSRRGLRRMLQCRALKDRQVRRWLYEDWSREPTPRLTWLPEERVAFHRAPLRFRKEGRPAWEVEVVQFH